MEKPLVGQCSLAQHIPMTKLVDQVVAEGLSRYRARRSCKNHISAIEESIFGVFNSGDVLLIRSLALTHPATLAGLTAYPPASQHGVLTRDLPDRSPFGLPVYVAASPLAPFSA